MLFLVLVHALLDRLFLLLLEYFLQVFFLQFPFLRSHKFEVDCPLVLHSSFGLFLFVVGHVVEGFFVLNGQFVTLTRSM